MHGDRVLVRIARIEAGGRADGEIVKVLKRAQSHRGGRIPPATGAASSSCRRTTASSSGSRSPRAWRFRPPGRRWTASASTPPKAASVEELRRHDRERRTAGISREGARDRWGAWSRFSAVPTISAWMSKSSSASTICRTNFRPKWWSRRKPFRQTISDARSGRPPRFPRHGHRHHRRRDRARFRRCGLGGPPAPTATTRCTCISPT